MFGRFNRLLQLASLIAWATLVAMLWDRARSWALGLLAAGALMAILTLLTWRLQRRAINDLQQLDGSDPRAAHLLVTRMLAELTRVQVAYLGQSFGNEQQGRSWLKNALPRGYRSTIAEMHGLLEAARSGQEPDGLRLALRLHALRDRVHELDAALKRAAEQEGEADLAHPAAFVITEEIALDDETGEPPIVLVAAWNPRRSTLIPRVDQLTIIDDVEGKKRVRGQLAFDVALAGKRLRRAGKAKDVYFAAASEDDDLTLNDIPLGFLVSGSDFV